MNKYIVSDLTDGLGNRLCALGSCIRIVKKLNTQLVIYWGVNKYCGCPYDQLFKDYASWVIQRNDGVTHFPKLYEDSHLIYKQSGLWEAIVKQRDLEDFKAIVVQTFRWAYLEEEYKNADISGDYNPHMETVIKEIGVCLKNIKMVSYITDEIQRWQQGIEGCVGVHVRRGDIVKHQNLRHASRSIPEQLYFDELDKTDEPIFLCTESLGVANQFENRYGHRVYRYYTRSHDRSTIEAIQDALIEMYLLASTKRIVAGPSSFNRIASVIGNIPLQTIIQDDYNQILI